MIGRWLDSLLVSHTRPVVHARPEPSPVTKAVNLAVVASIVANDDNTWLDKAAYVALPFLVEHIVLSAARDAHVQHAQNLNRLRNVAIDVREAPGSRHDV